MEQNREKTDKKKRRYLRTISFLVTFGALVFGYDTGVINGSLSFMVRKDQLNLSAATEGWVTSSLLLGAAIGGLFWGRLADKHGRKIILRILAVVFVIATIACSLSPSAGVIIVCRFILGIAVGGVAGIVPVYLSEIAPSEVRGSLVSQDQLMLVGGQLIAYIVNGILGNVFYDPGIWRYMIVMATIPAVVLWIGSYIFPETPRWLAMQGRMDEALVVLKDTRDDREAEADFQHIQQNVQKEKGMGIATLKEFSIPWVRRLAIIGIVVAAMQQLAGINIMLYYGTTLLEKAGFGTQTALVANIGNGILLVAGTAIYMVFLANRMKRRVGLITGYCVSTVMMVVIGIMAKVAGGFAILPYIIILCTMLFVFFFQTTLGPLTWLVLSEIFPLRIRGVAMGVATFALWIVDFLVGLFFPILLASIGMSMTFFVFGGIGIICVVGSILLIPETQGKTLEELEERFRSSFGKKEEEVVAQ